MAQPARGAASRCSGRPPLPGCGVRSAAASASAASSGASSAPPSSARPAPSISRRRAAMPASVRTLAANRRCAAAGNNRPRPKKAWPPRRGRPAGAAAVARIWRGTTMMGRAVGRRPALARRDRPSAEPVIVERIAAPGLSFITSSGGMGGPSRVVLRPGPSDAARRAQVNLGKPVFPPRRRRQG